MKGRHLLPFLLLLGVLAAGCGGGGGAATADGDDIATVGKLHIAKTRFVDEMSRARASMTAQKQKFPKEGTTQYEQLKSQAIWLLVLEKARELEADKLGIDVTDAQVTQRLASIKKDQFGGSETKFQAELKKEGLSEAETRAIVKGILVSDQLTTHITSDVKVSDNAIKDYYDEHKSEYPDTREVQYILVGKNRQQTAAELIAQGKDPKKDKDAAKQIAAAYIDAKKTAEEIYGQLKGGAKFAALAKKYSHDDSTKNTAGKLTAQKGQLVPKFNNVAFTMKTGSLSEPFETPEYGWFVVKANGPVKQTNEKDVAETIRQTLLQTAQNDAMTEWAGNLAKNICTGGKISYQIGYTPNPDPCIQYQAATTTTGVVALSDALVELQELTERLRRECPWDREQTERTIVPHTVEEAYEVADAALAGDDAKLLDELGDLLFQTYFLALLLSERGAGDLEAVARAIHAKLVARHPHVFGDAEAQTAGRVRENWERLKVEQEEREGVFHHVPAALPGLLYASKVQRRAAAAGFDWPDVAGPLEKLAEELHELDVEVARAGAPAPESEPDPRVADELGDVLFAAVNAARRLNVDPELVLRSTTQRFVARVERAQELAAEDGENWRELDLDAQDRWYERAKESLR